MMRLLAMIVLGGMIGTVIWFVISGGDVPPRLLAVGVSLGLVAVFLGLALVFKKAAGLVFNLFVLVTGAMLFIASTFASELGLYEGEGFWWERLLDDRPRTSFEPPDRSERTDGGAPPAAERQR